MSFLYPAFLLGALAVAIPIVLHLLRRDVAPDLPFTAVRLLKRSPVERSRRRRLRDLILLAARVVALLLLAAAFARPFAPAAESAALSLRIVAVDRSFSMNAPGRFDELRRLAQAAIDDAGFGERVALLAFDDRAEVLAPPGGASDARAALANLAPGNGGTRYSAVFAKASELAAAGSARLILVTDLQRSGWEGESRLRVPSSLEIEIRDVGAPAANLALADARVDGDRLVATVRSTAAEPRSGVVRVEAEGREAARAPFAAAAGSSVEVPIGWKPAAGGVAVSIDDGDGFPADNRRFLVVGAASSPSVLVVTSQESSGFYLQRALDVAQGADGLSLGAQLVTAPGIAGGRAEAIARQRAVVVLATRGLDRAARDAIAAFVRGGGGLFVAAGPEVEPEVLASLFEWTATSFGTEAPPRAASLTATDVRHPVFRPFGPLAANLGQVRFSRAWKLDPSGWHVAARFDDGSPALVERPAGEGRVVMFASDLDRRWNDFPVHPAFVPFVVETLRHVAARGGEPAEYLVGRTPAGVGAEPGVHRLESGRMVAVNVDPRESSTTAMTQDEFRAMLEPVERAPVDGTARQEQTESRQSLWQYGLLLMLGVLVAESLVGRA